MHSTETAVLKVLADLLLALDSGDLAMLTLLDLSIIIVIVIEMNIIKVALSHFCCRTTVQSDSVSVARQVTVRRW